MSLDYWLRREEIMEAVLEALESLHWERGLWRSFTIREVAEEAGLDSRRVGRALEDLRRSGLVGRRRGGRYYLKRAYRSGIPLGSGPSRIEL